MTKKECKKEGLKWNKDTKKCDRKRKQKQLKKLRQKKTGKASDRASTVNLE